MIGGARERVDVALARPGDRVTRADIAIDRERPVLAVVGTTATLEPAGAVELLPFLRAAMGVAAAHGAVVVTGGTDSGVLHVLGLTGEASVPVIGVAPNDLVVEPGVVPVDGQAAIDPHLHALVRVPGTAWGDETGAISRLVDEIRGVEPSAVLVVGGGTGARDEVVEHLVHRRPLVVLRGSGRLADLIADDRAAADPDLSALLAAGDVRVVSTSDPPSVLAHALDAALAGPPPAPRRTRVAVTTVLPRLRLRPVPPEPFLGPGAPDRYPALRDRIEEADRIVFPAFAALDLTAQAEQNRYRWFAVLALFGGLLTTAFGAMQAWLHTQPWPGVAVATLGAATSALTTVARRQGALQSYLTARLRAERLRSLYFEHLARDPAEGSGPDVVRALELAVANHRHGPVTL